ncbi:MAG: PEP-CTERM sorting domain-containing protein [Rhodocyclaceae bacterium]|nr:PEP-CTERM sorting domain-containing protein [Rhodocyclaceae bacterium]
MKLKQIVLAALLAAACSGANAAIVTYDVSWSGTAWWGSSETMSGTVTLDTSAWGRYSSGNTNGLVALDLVTSAAPSVHITLADIYDYEWTGAAGMNLNSQLIGQPSYGGSWGSYGSGSFFLLGNTLEAPSQAFTLVDNTTWIGMDPVSMTPAGAAAAPEPATLALLGIAGFGFLRRRRAF